MMPDLSDKSKAYIDMVAIILSTYCSTIVEVVDTRQGLSVCKTILLSFLIKNHCISKTTLYNGHHSKDLLSKAAIEATGQFESLRFELEFILQALLLLSKNDWIVIEDDRVFVGEDAPLSKKKRFDAFSEKLIEECYEVEDALMLKVVIRNV
ncbi:hypothetical protein [Eggerthella sp. YY7918]|uniref:hypothetical protein n=1 Tax=Eggerthella sp. (strain YY7918) TaxID=502558 RepID=UPI00124639A4|nr:hypothetical protein [Eggerthella sp. YY7918]